MPRLSEIQSAFTNALRDSDSAPPQGLTSHSTPRPQRRFHIYRNNVYSSLAETLGKRYPAVRRLVGEAFFRGLARAFIDDHPPTSPVLIEYGEGFAAFLSDFAPVADLPYLADVARLEWLYHRAYHAPDAVPLGPEELGTIPPEAVADTTFRLHPSLGLIRSDYPVYSIWRTNIHDDEVRPIRLDQGGEVALVLRPALEVVVHRVDAPMAALVEALARGAPLAAAAEEAASEAARKEKAGGGRGKDRQGEAFRLDAALAYLIDAGAFVGFESPAHGA